MSQHWPGIGTVAAEAFRAGVLEWIAAARVTDMRIQGPNAELPIGFLQSTKSFDQDMIGALTRAGASPAVARIIGSELWGAWKAWVDGLQMKLPNAFPGFAAVPGPRAPATKSAQEGYSLAKASSAGEQRLRASNLASRLTAALRAQGGAEREAQATIQQLSKWVESSFFEWKDRTQVIGLQGKGPIPTYAPPYVPVGPVVAGGIAPTGQGNVMTLAGPRFGKPYGMA